MTEKDREQRKSLSDDYLGAHTVGELTPLSEPIRVVDYDPEWPRQSQAEIMKIQTALGRRVLRVEHVGSTAVPDLPAKPVIDILLVVADSANEAEYLASLEEAGYRLRIREPAWYEHRMFKDAEQKTNVHVFSAGCPEIDRMLIFRDWLRVSETDRELYARWKRMLAQQDWKNTQNYADAKTSVIDEITSRARAHP
jgi:GrpB-like predicted nucleotidyltransferase (UPF0157 family)